MSRERSRKKVADIPVIGEVEDWESDIVEKLLDIPLRGECAFYIDSAGGNPYGALAVLTLLRQRQIAGTAYVLGECSSAAILLFAACSRRFVTRHSILLFHHTRWQSDKRVDSHEAGVWASHFLSMEKDFDSLQTRLFGAAEDQVRTWTEQGSYVTGPELVAAGLAELLEL